MLPVPPPHRARLRHHQLRRIVFIRFHPPRPVDRVHASAAVPPERRSFPGAGPPPAKNCWHRGHSEWPFVQL